MYLVVSILLPVSQHNPNRTLILAQWVLHGIQVRIGGGPCLGGDEYAGGTGQGIGVVAWLLQLW